MIHPKLYKRDTNGSVRVWWAETLNDGYRYHSGRLNGKIVTSKWTLCDYKNIGKKNELKPHEQAVAEVKAMYKKKKKRSYFEDIDTIDSCSLVKPMLAHHYKDYKDELKYPVYVQPKLDGIRCLATPEGLFTRKGEPINSCPHIWEVIEPLIKEYDVIFDGELYNHELKDDFNEIQSLVTRKHIDDKQALKIERFVEYHIYDLRCEGIFSERLNRLNGMKRDISSKAPIAWVPTKKVKEPEYLDDMYDFFLEDGYEGQMVRSDVEYEFKRTKALLKRKEFIDEEFRIKSIHEGKGNRSGMAGYAILELDKHRVFSAAFMGTNVYRKKLLAEKKQYVGEFATVKYFRRTPAGVPRFPVIKAIRPKGY